MFLTLLILLVKMLGVILLVHTLWFYGSYIEIRGETTLLPEGNSFIREIEFLSDLFTDPLELCVADFIKIESNIIIVIILVFYV